MAVGIDPRSGGNPQPARRVQGYGGTGLAAPLSPGAPPLPRPAAASPLLPSPDAAVPLRARTLLPAALLASLALLPLVLPDGVLPAATGDALALDPPTPGTLGSVTVLPDSSWALALPFDADLRSALGERRYSAAISGLAAYGSANLPGQALGDHAFLQAWSLARADRAAEALPLLEVMASSKNAPAPYLHLTRGEVLLAAGKPVEAAAELGKVDRDALIWPRARLVEAQALFKAGRTADSMMLYEELAARPDPASGSEVALWALAQRVGLSSPAARPLLQRLYRHYPNSSEGRQASKQFEALATADDKAFRGDAWMEAWSFDNATEILAPVVGSFGEADEAACVGWYAYGRSQFKRNNVTIAAEVLEPAGRRCVGIDDDRGAKALYVAGKSLERKKEWAAAARAYEQIPALYPDHSMADDGYALAGIAWQQAGQPDKARGLWEQQVQAYPDGDLAAEGFWRLAWLAYLDGDADKAIGWAEQMIWQVPLKSDPVHVQAAHYWAARWRIHPDVRDPAAFSPDKESVQRGIELLAQLCAEYPTSFYATMAANRLYELAPDKLAGIDRPDPLPDLGGWVVRTEWLAQPSVGWGLALSRLGLTREALAELGRNDTDQLLPSEYAVQAEVAGVTDPFAAHDTLHRYLLHHPAETLGPDRDRMIHTAFPDLFWDEVQSAAADYDYDPRIFHALVREESSFNVKARSHAGARGLSQLMPRTGTHVARKMGLNVSVDALYQPELNLRIGTNYYDSLVRRFDGNLYLSTPAYNAGEGNVEKWLAADPGRPTDEFVESIPLRETRHYVKRVMGTWQLYRVTYDDGPLFRDLSAYNHVARD